MTKLIVYGNINVGTFCNSLVAAQGKSFEMFGDYIDSIYVIHSSQSQDTLSKELENKKWKDYLTSNSITSDLFTHKIINLDQEDGSLSKFIDYVGGIIPTLLEKEIDLIIDVSNGTTFQRNILSIVSYILGIQDQYMIDFQRLRSKTENFEMVDPSILLDSYVRVPNITELDNMSYLGLMEIARYKNIIEMRADGFRNIDSDAADYNFFRENLKHSVNLKLLGDQNGDQALYKISVAALSANIEELMELMVNKYDLPEKNKDNRTLGNKLDTIQKKVRDRLEEETSEELKQEFDYNFFCKFNDFIKYLRNQNIHKKHRLSKLEKFKADLSIKLAFSFIELYTDIVHPLLSDLDRGNFPPKVEELYLNNPTENYYYGLDGDDTGSTLENLFSKALDESQIKNLSQNITNAIDEISDLIKKRDNSQIVFNAGDDLLFKGQFSRSDLNQMQTIYEDKTGLTCSIGYGKSLQETYIALKRAKLYKRQPEGSKRIVGIRFVK
ncbi:mCpol domain-containing protein [Geitlerinema sp. P-1104]|uniref:mCpol domain-containing protein n=1 Tax=Geitlerinema sp. P-1104 TaxID=2546230 RepID=UPI00147734FB|nr:mCpol domain-containing protein [Geitlerinema sp. P-1104]NMG60822.1 mCpol domain-containing protein [Geitlerinema sp. P-1104]